MGRTDDEVRAEWCRRRGWWHAYTMSPLALAVEAALCGVLLWWLLTGGPPERGLGLRNAVLYVAWFVACVITGTWLGMVLWDARTWWRGFRGVFAGWRGSR